MQQQSNAAIRECTASEFETVRSVINDAALAYRGVIPLELYREPWMSSDYLTEELFRGVVFSGAWIGGELIGVMGVQDVGDVTLIRHSYVRTAQRRSGIGSALLAHQLQRASRPVLVGCLKAMTWAITFYQKHGFQLVSDEERDLLRARYWNLSPQHVAQSVVLVDNRWLARVKR